MARLKRIGEFEGRVMMKDSRTGSVISCVDQEAADELIVAYAEIEREDLKFPVVDPAVYDLNVDEL